MKAVWDTPVGPMAVEIDLEPLTRDLCEVCGLTLYPSERVEIAAPIMTGEREPSDGGGGILATYCQEHAPHD